MLYEIEHTNDYIELWGFFQLKMRGEGFSLDHLCDTLLSSSFRTVNLDFDFYTNEACSIS